MTDKMCLETGDKKPPSAHRHKCRNGMATAERSDSYCLFLCVLESLRDNNLR